MSQTVDLRTAVGGVEYTFPLVITESTGKDISGATIMLSLGGSDAPGTWQAPDRDPAQTVKSQRVVQLLIGGSLKPPAGSYWLWSKVLDSPEVVARRQQQVTILA